MGGLFSSSTTTATTTHSPPTEKKNEILLIGEGILIDSAMTAFAYNLEWIRRKNKKKRARHLLKHKKRMQLTLNEIEDRQEVIDVDYDEKYWDERDKKEERSVYMSIIKDIATLFGSDEEDIDEYFDVDLTMVTKIDLTNASDEVRNRFYELFKFLVNVQTIVFSYITYDDLVKFVTAICDNYHIRHSVKTIHIKVIPEVHYKATVDDDALDKDEECLAALLFVCKNLEHFSVNGHHLVHEYFSNALIMRFNEDDEIPSKLKELEFTNCHLDDDSFMTAFKKAMYQIILYKRNYGQSITFGNLYSVNTSSLSDEEKNKNQSVRWHLFNMEELFRNMQPINKKQQKEEEEEAGKYIEMPYHYEIDKSGNFYYTSL